MPTFHPKIPGRKAMNLDVDVAVAVDVDVTVDVAMDVDFNPLSFLHDSPHVLLLSWRHFRRFITLSRLIISRKNQKFPNCFCQ